MTSKSIVEELNCSLLGNNLLSIIHLVSMALLLADAAQYILNNAELRDAAFRRDVLQRPAVVS